MQLQEQNKPFKYDQSDDSSDDYTCSCDKHDFISVCISCQLLLCDFCSENHKSHNHTSLKRLKADVSKLAKKRVTEIQQQIQQPQGQHLLNYQQFNKQLTESVDKWLQIDKNVRQLKNNQDKAILNSIFSYIDLDHETDQLLNQIEKSLQLSVPDQINNYYQDPAHPTHTLDQNTFNIYIDTVVKTIIPDLIKNAVEQVKSELKQQQQKDTETIQKLLKQIQIQLLQQQHEWKKLHGHPRLHKYLQNSKEVFGVYLFSNRESVCFCGCGSDVLYHMGCPKPLYFTKLFFICSVTHRLQQLYLGNKEQIGITITKDDMFYDLPTGKRIHINYTYHKLSDGKILKQNSNGSYFDDQDHLLTKIPISEILFSVSLFSHQPDSLKLIGIEDIPNSPMKCEYTPYYSDNKISSRTTNYILYKPDLL